MTKDLVELTEWGQQYLIAHKLQHTVQLTRDKQRKPTQSKPDVIQGHQRSLQSYRCQGYGHRQSDCPSKVCLGKDLKTLTPVRVTGRRFVQCWLSLVKMVKRLVHVRGLGADQQCQTMSVNHKLAFSSHLGIKKTEVRILLNFFWPGLRQDVIKYAVPVICAKEQSRGVVSRRYH